MQQHAMAGFRGDMGGQGMTEPLRVELLERCHRRAAGETVEQNRNAPVSRGKRRPQNRGKLAAPERGGDVQRIAEQRSMAKQRLVDDRLFARKAELVDARAAASP